ncbi:MAG: hypothetical protein WB608_01370 [Terracidiphilus sp.]
MKRILLLALVFSFSSIAHAQAVAPSTCVTHPCLNVTWNDTGAPGTALVAYCVGSAAGCGTSPATPGANGWIEYSVAEATAAGTAILPGLAYSQGGFVCVQFTSTGGGASGWTAPVPFQIGQAPQSPLPTGVIVTQN